MCVDEDTNFVIDSIKYLGNESIIWQMVDDKRKITYNLFDILHIIINIISLLLVAILEDQAYKFLIYWHMSFLVSSMQHIRWVLPWHEMRYTVRLILQFLQEWYYIGISIVYNSDWLLMQPIQLLWKFQMDIVGCYNVAMQAIDK